MEKRITKIVLENIKSHLSTTILMDPGFNVIAGESDEGKSVIFWAVNWVLFNKPFGWNPKPWPILKAGRESRVEIHFADGKVVARVRTPSENYYEFDGEKLSPKGGVPDKIAAFINMGESNIQRQKDTFFLLDETPGQAAREISKVANLEGMDAAKKEAADRVKATKKKISDSDKLLEEKKQELEESIWVKVAGEALTQLNEQEQELDSTVKNLQKTEASIEKFTALSMKLLGLADPDCRADAVDILKRAGSCERLGEKLYKINQKVEATNSLKKYLADLFLLSTCKAEIKSLLGRKDVLQMKRVAIKHQLKSITKVTEAKEAVRSAIPEDCSLRFQKMATKLSAAIKAGKTVKSVAEKNIKAAFLEETITSAIPLLCHQNSLDLIGRLAKTDKMSAIISETAAKKLEALSLRNRIALYDEDIEDIKRKKADLMSTLEVCPLCSHILT